MSNVGVMEPITSRVKREEKKEFTKNCEKIGTSPSNAIRMFVAAFNKRGGFPFEPTISDGLNATTLKAIDDVSKNKGLTGPFDSASEALASIFEDE